MPQLVHPGRLMAPPRRVVAGGVPAWVMANASLDLDFANNRYYDGSSQSFGSVMTIARASVGYARSSDGTFTAFGNDALRRSDLGALLENAATNLILNSQDLGNASWAPARAVITTGQTAPDGSTTAALMADDANSGTHAIQTSSTQVTYTSGTTYVMSIYAKAGTSNFLQMTFPSTRFTGLGYANFNLSTGAVSQTGGTLVGSGCVKYSNGWCLCYIAATCNSSGTGQGTQTFCIQTGTDGRAPSYVGSGLDRALWNPQNEVGSYPSSPVITGATAVARAADNLTVTGANAQAAVYGAKSAFSDTQFTNFLTAGVVCNINAGLLQASSDTQMQTSNGTNTATATIGSSGTFSANEVKTAYGFDGTNLTAKANGGTLATTAATWGQTSGTITVGNRSALDRAIRGYLKRLAFSATQSNFDALTV